METIRKIIEREKKMPKPDQDLINNLESFIKTGTITVKAGKTHHCINSDDINSKKNIK